MFDIIIIMDTTEKVAAVALSGTALFFSIFYRLYKKRNRTADEIKVSTP